MNGEHTERNGSVLSRNRDDDMTPRDRRNLYRYGQWLVSFGMAYGASLFLLSRDGLVEAPLVRWLLALAPNALGVMTMLAYIRFLRCADELVRKVHLEATAFAFGVGVLFTLGYRLAEQAGAPEQTVLDPVTLMLFCAALGPWLGMRRYR